MVIHIVIQNAVQGLKIQVIKIKCLVIRLSLITIHYCAEDQLAWSDVVQIRTPYYKPSHFVCNARSCQIRDHYIIEIWQKSLAQI